MAAKVPTTFKANVEQSAAAAATGGPAMALADGSLAASRWGFPTAESLRAFEAALQAGE